MSSVPVNNITWNAGVVNCLLHEFITTGAHLHVKKWKEAALSFYSSVPYLQKRICQTMGWRDYNQGNLSAFDGDLGPVEAKMCQIIQERREKGRKREDEVKTKRIGDIGVSSLVP